MKRNVLLAVLVLFAVALMLTGCCVAPCGTCRQAYIYPQPAYATQGGGQVYVTPSIREGLTPNYAVAKKVKKPKKAKKEKKGVGVP